MKKPRLSICCAALVVAVTLPAAAPAAAQGINLQLVPKAGLSMPIGTLGDDTEIENGFALGVAAELILPGLPVNLRANLDYALPADIVERSAAERVQGEATILNIAGDVVLRPLPATAAAQPYFMGGLGVRTFDISVATTVGPDLGAASGRTTRFALHVGGGLDVRAGPLAFVLELSDYISTLRFGEDSSLQHGVFGMVGFRVSMF
jgi:opacity protein-like surface antigen